MTNRPLKTKSLGIFCSFFAGVSPLPAQDHPTVIDTHVHLWHLDRPEGIYWIKKDNKTLYRSFMPEEHEPVAKANGVDGVVIVQAGQHLPDNQWNLDVTAHNKALYRGVVGNLSQVIGTDDFQPLFGQLCKDERYLGYRLSGRNGEKLSEEFFRDLKATAQSEKTVDFLIGNYSLEDVDTIARRVPNLKIILDHFGSVVLDGQPLDPVWENKFRAVAKHPNVHCKVSALFGRVKKQPAPQNIGFYQSILGLAFESFGEDRLVFGSDWPVTRTTGDYASVLKLTRAYFDKKGPGVSKKLFSSNAQKFYSVNTGHIEKGTKSLPLPGESFKINGRDTFIILPEKTGEKIPWVWYAPTLKGLPAKSEVWMFERFLAKGVAIAGIDVGESYGSPEGRDAFTDLYTYLTQKRNFVGKPCLLARSRGGLMLYNWAVENPTKVGGVAGIYPVCNLESYPGLARAAGAYKMTAEELKKVLDKHNPIDRLKPLAEAHVPIFHIQGDSDTVVPHEKNTQILAERYRRFGGTVEVEVIKGQGHNMWRGWFESENLTNFAIARALGHDLPKKK
ncbi:MAG: amidohydrolase family protein [Akkermansiaceae bacterium]|jgi:predicted TIM-barrel fold metal-dependent hydrolase